MIRYLFILAVSFSLAQTPIQTHEQWVSLADGYLAGNFDGTANRGGDEVLGVALRSNCNAAMYFEQGIFFGFVRLWQATGDFDYLDQALDQVEFKIDNAIPNLDDYYDNNPSRELGGYWSARLPYKGFVQQPNYYLEVLNGPSFSDDWSYYIFADYNLYLNYGLSNTLGKYTYIYNMARDLTVVWATTALNENVYFAHVAEMLRVMNNNDEIFTLTSGNGQTYQQRFNDILAFVEEHIWEKWAEYESTPTHKKDHVYRSNTHMASHLPRIAANLWSITGEAKYRDFVEEFLYDWGSSPDEFYAPNGWGILDQLQYFSAQDGYFWSNGWGNAVSPSSGTDSFQDISHSGNEFQFFVTCFEVGIGTSPPAGHPAINQTFINRLANTFKEGFLNGNLTGSLDYRMKPGVTSVKPNNSRQVHQGNWVLAEYDPEILYVAENKDGVGSDFILFTLGTGAYAARVHGVNGATPPPYPTQGNGAGISNFAPVVQLVGDAQPTVLINTTYTEQGATWTDVEDGSGTIASPTTGSVNTSVLGTYTLTYTYTDAGGKSDTETRTVTVSNTPNDCPFVTLVGNASISISLNGTYTEQGATFEDIQDGSGTIATPTTGSVNTAVAGTYLLVYSYTDLNGCTESVSRSVEVIPAGNILATSLNFVESNEVINVQGVGDVQLPEFVLEPSNATTPFVGVSSSNQEVIFVDPNGQLIGLAEGTAVITIFTFDGSNLSDSITINIGASVPVTTISSPLKGSIVPHIIRQ
jgi:hypothetical protein